MSVASDTWASLAVQIADVDAAGFPLRPLRVTVFALAEFTAVRLTRSTDFPATRFAGSF